MGKPEIYFANMGHGEAIAFGLNGQWYLRDFGEYSHRKNILTSCHVETVLDRKCADCVFSNFSNATGRAGEEDKRWIAILSHSHRDHFSGFKGLYERLKKISASTKIFKKAYLPDLYQDRAKLEELTDNVMSCVLIHAFSQNDIEKNEAKNFLIYHTVMAALSDELIFCDHHRKEGNAGLNFYAPVNWTNRNHDSADKENDLRLELEHFRKNNNISESQKNRIENATQGILKIIQKYYDNPRVDFSRAVEDHKIILDLLKGIVHTKNINLFSLPFWNNRNIDDNSLIFSIGEDERWLFLGDSTDDALKKIYAVNNFEKEYYGIKAGHHGTRGGETLREKHIHCKKSIICTGKGHYALNPPQPSYLEISDECFTFDYPYGSSSSNMKNINVCQCCNLNNRSEDPDIVGDETSGNGLNFVTGKYNIKNKPIAFLRSNGEKDR